MSGKLRPMPFPNFTRMAIRKFKSKVAQLQTFFSLDPEQKDELVQILDKLLADRTTLVVGSAVMAFEEVT